MKLSLLKMITIGILGMVILSSCSKNDNNGLGFSKKELLVGTWKIVAIATDKNDNQTRDANETIVSPDTANIFEYFYSDGTGKVTSKVGSQPEQTTPFLWKFTSNETQLEITVDNDIRTVKILTLTTLDLNAVDITDADNYLWYDLKKQ